MQPCITNTASGLISNSFLVPARDLHRANRSLQALEAFREHCDDSPLNWPSAVVEVLEPDSQVVAARRDAQADGVLRRIDRVSANTKRLLISVNLYPTSHGHYWGQPVREIRSRSFSGSQEAMDMLSTHQYYDHHAVLRS